VVWDFGRDERGEGTDVAVVIFGIDVDADGFEAKGELVLEVSEGNGGIGWEHERRADEDLDAAAKGGGSVVSDAQGQDG